MSGGELRIEATWDLPGLVSERGSAPPHEPQFLQLGLEMKGGTRLPRFVILCQSARQES